ncbi:GNAT family N-acetyltransferase [Nocardioides mangrovi]|uniref:GNAT family N-acetyltransferase n=1 Tax=Nocardioides mangrovi TaxID=2874580 RepID=A0ABS7UBS7_9ACTN|nr:GNAT family N-acetyltransferase [Nocardioides mangrovi]MBZ5738459.1 GNAT family N-acetyltransferase [Nocardioides mangrovi]
MTTLSHPDASLADSWSETIAEFHAAGEEHVHGAGLWEFDDLDVSPAGCAAVAERLVALGDTATPIPEDRVHCTYFWMTDGDGPTREVVGFLALRHALTPWLLEEGGHIGYAVRPARRREGHAGRALALAVGEAGALGLDRVLVTCDDDNVGSRRTIEAGGGVYEDTRNHKLRYWIDTAGK